MFGFHLCPLDLRQHSGVHERVVSELLARATGKRGYEALAEPERQALLLRELWTPRPLVSPHVTYGEETTQALATLAATARVRARFGERAIPNYVISMTAAPSDVLEVALLLKEVGPAGAGRGADAAGSTSSRCSRPSRTCGAPAPCSTSCSRSPTTASCSRAAATCRR